MTRAKLTTIATGVLAFAASAATAQETSPIQISLVTPVQIVNADKAVSGFRWDIIYGRNTYVVGLDIGLVNHTTSGVSQGLQWGVVNFNEASFVGWQDGGVNFAKRAFTGLQSGFVNSTGQGEGVQWGVVNVAQFHNGLQFGLVNYAESFHGLQIGLINIIKQGGAFPVFPIVNWSF